LAHGRVIDTSIIYPHSRGPPFRYSLRQLASKYLGRTIQQHAFDDQDQPIGHDSIEDAITCLDLVKLKLKHGLNFGKPLRETVSLFHRLSHQDQPRKSLVVDYPTEQWLAEDATTFIPCTSDDQIIDQMIAQLGSYHLVIGRLHALEQLYSK
jgi:RNA exonuclease 1